MNDSPAAASLSGGNLLDVSAPAAAGEAIDGEVLRIEVWCTECSEAYEVPVTSTNELPTVFCTCGEPCAR